MKAIILSAGQGKRLLPHTADKPKCTVPVSGQSIVKWQIQELLRLGIDSIHIVVGFGAEKVEALLAEDIASGSVRTIYNPFFAMSDNLMSGRAARNDMSEDFLLINGDTLFESVILDGLL
ncbi:MAG: NTP transferase domain-containing protein [Nitrospira sp.]|nr:NTP transferase domain-containing protein [Nitrospira sp.]